MITSIGRDQSMKKGDLKFIQELNQSIIFNMIRNEGPISRSEIAKKTKLSPSTVTSAVAELISEGVVVDGEVGKSSGGRRPTLVRFEPNNKFLIGVSITNSNISIANMNLDAYVNYKKAYPMQAKSEEVIEYVLQLLEEYIEEINDLSTCIGISIITPGIVDSVNGIIRYNAKLHLYEIPLKEMVEEKFGIKTWVENDANAIVLAEKQFGTYRNMKNIVYIQVGDGLGSGIIMNNSIFRGGGEFGHITIDWEGIECECGNIGCLENYVSWPAIQSKIALSLSNGAETQMMNMANGSIEKISQLTFRKALSEGDPLAKLIVEETASYLATGIVSVINLLNPEVILIGWDIIYDNLTFISKIHKEVERKTFDIFKGTLKIQPTTLGEDFELKGAAAVLLSEVFEFSYSRS